MPSGDFTLHHPLDAVRHLIQRSTPSAMLHAPLTAELVDQDAVTGMSLDIFEQQRRTTGRIRMSFLK